MESTLWTRLSHARMPPTYHVLVVCTNTAPLRVAIVVSWQHKLLVYLITQVRTSTGCFLDGKVDPEGVLLRLEQKIAAVTHLPTSHGEVRLTWPYHCCFSSNTRLPWQQGSWHECGCHTCRRPSMCCATDWGSTMTATWCVHVQRSFLATVLLPQTALRPPAHPTHPLLPSCVDACDPNHTQPTPPDIALYHNPRRHVQDTFDEQQFGKQASQRVATFLCYLRSPEEGGETVFKREGEGRE